MAASEGSSGECDIVVGALDVVHCRVCVERPEGLHHAGLIVASITVSIVDAVLAGGPCDELAVLTSADDPPIGTLLRRGRGDKQGQNGDPHHQRADAFAFVPPRHRA